MTRLAIGTALAAVVLVTSNSPVGRGFTRDLGASATVVQETRRSIPQSLSDGEFAKLIDKLSEPAGAFDSDNLVSNESGYLHPLPRMAAIGVKGGAYIGVGPDQNYTYIAAVRPEIAFMLDIRRDAGLQHLMYKQLMLRGRNRMEFLSLLFGRRPPQNVAKWAGKEIPEILGQIDKSPMDQAFLDSTIASVRRGIVAMAHEVSETELATIARIHTEFARSGPDIQYSSLYGHSRRNYPTFRSLLVEKDLNGEQHGYLTTEDRYQFVKTMHARNLIVPVTGNLAGTHALRAIGDYVRDRGMAISVLYASNVEFYLMADQLFDPFAENVSMLPRNDRTVIIRSVFNNMGYFAASRHSNGQPSAISEQLLQKMDSFVEAFKMGGYKNYNDVVSIGILPLAGGGK